MALVRTLFGFLIFACLISYVSCRWQFANFVRGRFEQTKTTTSSDEPVETTIQSCKFPTNFGWHKFKANDPIYVKQTGHPEDRGWSSIVPPKKANKNKLPYRASSKPQLEWTSYVNVSWEPEERHKGSFTDIYIENRQHLEKPLVLQMMWPLEKNLSKGDNIPKEHTPGDPPSNGLRLNLSQSGVPFHWVEEMKARLEIMKFAAPYSEERLKLLQKEYMQFLPYCGSDMEAKVEARLGKEMFRFMLKVDRYQNDDNGPLSVYVRQHGICLEKEIRKHQGYSYELSYTLVFLDNQISLIGCIAPGIKN